MKQSTLIGISILSVIILCSLSYQPIVADNPIEEIEEVKESKLLDIDTNIYRELKSRINEIKSQVNEDCDCTPIDSWGFPIICTTLLILSYTLWSLSTSVSSYFEGFILWTMAFSILFYVFALGFNCQWINVWRPN